MRGCSWPAHKKRLKLITDFTLCMSYTQYSFTEHLKFCKMCFNNILSGYCFHFQSAVYSLIHLRFCCLLANILRKINFQVIQFSHKTVIRQSADSCQAFVRQLSGSCQAVIRQSSGSRQAVVRQIAGNHQPALYLSNR